jgi:hypothetical protein
LQHSQHWQARLSSHTVSSALSNLQMNMYSVTLTKLEQVNFPPLTLVWSQLSDRPPFLVVWTKVKCGEERRSQDYTTEYNQQPFQDNLSTHSPQDNLFQDISQDNLLSS